MSGEKALLEEKLFLLKNIRMHLINEIKILKDANDEKEELSIKERYYKYIISDIEKLTLKLRALKPIEIDIDLTMKESTYRLFEKVYLVNREDLEINEELLGVFVRLSALFPECDIDELIILITIVLNYYYSSESSSNIIDFIYDKEFILKNILTLEGFGRPSLYKKFRDFLIYYQ